MSPLRMPDVLAGGRWHSGDELDATGRGWLAVTREAIGDRADLVALVPPTTAEGVTLLIALSSLPVPIMVLSTEARAWRTEPPIPRGTPVILPPSTPHLAAEAEKIGLRPIVLPLPTTRAAGPPIDGLSGPGIVVCTSGSSSWPKPVFFRMETQRAWIASRAWAIGMAPGQGVVMEASPAYAQGLTHVLTAVLVGGPLALLDSRDHRQALITLADPRFGYWRTNAPFASALATCALTGPAIVPPLCFVSSRIPDPVADAFEARFGVPLRQSYSSTETGTIALDNSPPDRVQRDTVGRLLPGVEVHIGDHPSQAASPGEIGRIWFRGPWQMAGYGFPPHVERPGDVEGWWPTHDRGVLRSDGYLVLAGRLDDAIRSRDNRTVSLVHVATAIAGLPGVRDVAVVPVDGAGGLVFGAVVESDASLTAAELRTKLAGVLPPWSSPRVIEIVAALPRLANGKPDRQACARLLASRAP